MKFRPFILLCVFFLLSNCVYAMSTGETHFEIHPLVDDVPNVLAHIAFEPFELERLSFASDVYFQKDEFDYLVGLKEGTIVDAAQLSKALFYCLQKNIFETISVSIHPGSEAHKKGVHFSFVGFWTFETVRFKGIWFGKDAYRPFYRFEWPDRFDLEKHAHYIHKLHELLHQDGYFLGTVDSQLQYHEHTKSVSVILTINQGDRFTVGNVCCRVQQKDRIDQIVCDQVYERASHYLHKKLAGCPYNRSLLNKTITYLKNELFKEESCDVQIELQEHVLPENKQVDLHFNLTISAQRVFVFWGNRHFSDAHLFQKIKQFGHSVWHLPSPFLAQQLVAEYQDAGFWQAHVEAQEEPGRTFFLIHENERSHLSEVRLAGVHQFDSDRLSKQFFSAALQTRYPDQAVFKKAMQELIDFYEREGFLDARVIKQEIGLSSSGKHVLTIFIEEGDQSWIADVTVEGDQEVQAQSEFQKLVGEKKPYKSLFLEEQKTWLTHYFETEKKQAVQIRPVISRNGLAVHVVWKIDASESYMHFGKTVASGCLTFPFDALMREMECKEEAPWGQQVVRKSVDHLSQLHIFESVHAYPELVGPCERALILRAHNDRQFEVRTRLGVGIQPVKWPFSIDDFTYKVGGSFLIKNPTNRGDAFRIDMDVTRVYRTMLLNYDCPWIGGLPWNMSVQGYGMRYCQPYLCCAPSGLYEIRQKGFFTSFKRRLEAINAALNVGVEWESTYFFPPDDQSVNALAHAFNFLPCMVGIDFPYAYFEPTVSFEALDNTLNPRRGFFTLISCKAMLPLRSRQLFSGGLRCVFEHSFFIPTSFLTWAFRLRLGALLWRDIRSTMLNERFYLGGAQSLRGYDVDCTPPFGKYESGGCSFVVPQGGNALINACAEVRFPLFYQLSGALFQDVGVLSDNVCRFNARSGVLSSTGFGIRYETPLGPLRFDIGWKWPCKKSFGRSYAWFLTFGHMF